MQIDKIEQLLKEQDELIVHRLEDLASKYPSKPYLYYGETGKRLTYGQFNELTNALAHSLLDLGLQKGEIIPIFLRNSYVSVLSMFGIWKSSCIYAPINFSYKGKLLAYQLKDMQAKVLITEQQMFPSILEIVHETNLETIIVYTGDEETGVESIENTEIKLLTFVQLLEEGSKEQVNHDLDYTTPANIFYTSGTTGLPKGVVQSYRWMNQYTFYRRRFFNEDDVIYNDLPLYHVGGAIFNIVSATWAGASIALWDKFSGSQFWNRIKESGATSVLLLDVMIPWLMNPKEKPTDRENTVHKVYMQPLPQYHHQVAKRFGFDIVMCGYGQTEAGQGAVGVIKELESGEGTPPELLKGKTPKQILEVCRELDVAVVDGSTELSKGFMGKPSMLVEMAILNEHDEACKTGDVGQLAFRPRVPFAINHQYFNNPEATVSVNKNLWFHTGDAAYQGEDGYYYFVDRMGSIIRVKGELVSSYQVEDYINSHPNVQVSAVLPVPAEVGDEDDIAAFIVLNNKGEAQKEEIDSWLKEQLPKFMWPKYIRFVDELPRTPSSKIEKYKLRELLYREKECN